MGKLHPPIANIASWSLNPGLHGRSVFHPANVPGNNVYKGFQKPGTGDAIDFLCPASTPVYALDDCIQVRHVSDMTNKEAIYLQGDGFLAVYGIIDAVHSGIGHRFGRGDVVARVRGDVQFPCLHFELWLDNKVVSAPSAGKLRMKLMSLMGLWPFDLQDSAPRLIVIRNAKKVGDASARDRIEIPAHFDKTTKTFSIDTLGLSNWLNVPLENDPGILLVREALQVLGYESIQYSTDLTALNDTMDPRAYILL